jgi:hypothetical protein
MSIIKFLLPLLFIAYSSALVIFTIQGIDFPLGDKQAWNAGSCNQTYAMTLCQQHCDGSSLVVEWLSDNSCHLKDITKGSAPARPTGLDTIVYLMGTPVNT